MATQAPANPTTTAAMNGTVGALAGRVLNAPEGGAGIYFAAFPLGIALQLGALGVVLGLLSCANAQLFSPNAGAIVIPVAFAVGSVAITAGGIINFRAGNLIAGVIGVLYGVFWLSFGLLQQFFAAGIVTAAGGASTGDAVGTYLMIWAIVSAFLAVGTYYINRVVFAQQTILVAVFVLLALANMAAPGGAGLVKLGGWVGLVDAFLALYISAALLINDTAGKEVLPFR